jgi:hypothetical protein
LSDILQVLPAVESYADLRSGALVVDLPDVGTVAFCGYDDLVAMKEAAGRESDLLDLTRLREARGEV